MQTSSKVVEGIEITGDFGAEIRTVFTVGMR